LTGDELAAAYASFDIFVSPGELETFGQTIQEALASGVPVVAPRRGGPIDLVTDDNGILYEPGAVEQLVQAVESLAGSAELRATAASAARASVEGRTWQSVCEQLIGYYEEAGRERSAERERSA
jgi:phosphatidylinositol alpha 1,6-mannosyltransferase